MRKIFPLILTLICFRGWLQAADSSSVDIVMTIQVLGFHWVEQDPNVTVSIDQNAVDNRRVMQSDANTQQDYSIRVASQSAPPSWTLVTSSAALGSNKYRLRALWHQDSVKPATSEFQANDILTNSSAISSTTRFWNDVSETHTVAGFEGFNVYPSQHTSLYIWVEGAPSGQPGPLTAVLGVTVSATP